MAREVDQHLAQPSPEKLPPIAGAKRYRDPQPDKELGPLSPKWDVYIKSFPQSSGNYMEDEVKRVDI